MTKTLVFQSPQFDLSGAGDERGEPEPWGRDCATVISDSLGSASFSIEGPPVVDEGGWLIIATKGAEVYSLRVHVFTRHAFVGQMFWACHVSFSASLRERVFGSPRRSHFDALCDAIEDAVRIRGGAFNLQWFGRDQFNNFAQ